ncbi:MAG: hypothetical protein V3U84_04145 [Thiotrichaceae bacterium]
MIGGFPPTSGTKDERKLLSLFKSLTTKDQQTLLKFSAFLADAANDNDQNVESADQEELPLPAPLSIGRPAEESVIKAIKRLNKTYPMINKSLLLDKTSSFMTDHILKGRDAAAVIDDLEAMFKTAYEDLL